MDNSPILENLAFWTIGAGVLIIVLLLAIGLYVFSSDRIRRLIEKRLAGKDDDEAIYEPRIFEYLKATCKDELERRNEFWFGFGQIIIVALIIVTLTALLFTSKISPEAGLPIISGLSGFAIAKSVDTGKNRRDSDNRG
jgi:hypothetical protein